MRTSWLKISGLLSVMLMTGLQPVHAEDVKISTYYPSPYGNYRDLEVSRNAYLASTDAAGKVGVGYANGTALASTLSVKGSGAFMNAAGTAGVTLSQNGANGSLQSTGDLLMNSGAGNVGIGGAPNNSYKLDVTGSTRVNGSFVITSGGNTGPLNVVWDNASGKWTAAYAA